MFMLNAFQTNSRVKKYSKQLIPTWKNMKYLRIYVYRGILLDKVLIGICVLSCVNSSSH
jgi:hypothetical protein